jgi:hypothetical protein
MRPSTSCPFFAAAGRQNIQDHASPSLIAPESTPAATESHTIPSLQTLSQAQKCVRTLGALAKGDATGCSARGEELIDRFALRVEAKAAQVRG